MACHTKHHIGGARREWVQPSSCGAKGESEDLRRCLYWGSGWSIIGVFERHEVTVREDKEGNLWQGPTYHTGALSS